MGSRVKRNIGKKTYLYYVYYDQGARKEMYCGDMSKPAAQKRAIKYEIDDLAKRKRIISDKIADLKRQLQD